MNTFIKAEDKTVMDLKEVETTIKLPKIVVEKQLPEQFKELTAVVILIHIELDKHLLYL